MEITSSADKLALNWKSKVKDWNLNAALPADTPLPNGKQVERSRGQGFYDHGTDFGILGEQKFRMALNDIKKAYREANLLAVFSHPRGDIVWYQFRHKVTGNDQDIRSGIYPASAYFLFENGEGERFVNQVKQEPSLLDALVKAQFPIYGTTIKTEPWKEILFLPQELFFKTMNDQIEVVAFNN